MSAEAMFEARCQYECDKITERLTRFGFVVKSVKAHVDLNCCPEVGFAVVVVQMETPASRQFIEGCLRDYAYNLKFVDK